MTIVVIVWGSLQYISPPRLAPPFATTRVTFILKVGPLGPRLKPQGRSQGGRRFGRYRFFLTELPSSPSLHSLIFKICSIFAFPRLVTWSPLFLYPSPVGAHTDAVASLLILK